MFLNIAHYQSCSMIPFCFTKVPQVGRIQHMVSIQTNYTQMYCIHQIYNTPCSSILPTTKVARLTKVPQVGRIQHMVSIQTNYTQMYLIHQIYNIPCSSILPTTKVAQWFHFALQKCLQGEEFRWAIQGHHGPLVPKLFFCKKFFQEHYQCVKQQWWVQRGLRKFDTPSLSDQIIYIFME